MRPTNSIDLKSQHFHNRMVNDLRKNKQEQPLPERQDNNIKNELYTTFISHRIRTKRSKNTIQEKQCFEEEYRQFLNENGIDIDERYFLKE